jgi:phenylacetate-CoA ligase
MATLTEKLYYHSPIRLQNFFISAKGLEFRYRRANNKIVEDQFRFLLKSENWSSEQYRNHQIKEMRKLLNIAFHHVPYYREIKKKLGCDINDFKKPEDIYLLPIIEKDLIRKNPELFVNETINPKKLGKAFTGGTTGTPLTFYEMRESFSRRWAFVVRLRSWAGLRNPFYPKLAHFTGRKIISPDQKPEIHKYWRWNKFGNSLLFSSYHITPEAVPYYAKALMDFQPELIDGFPTALLTIARISRRLGLRLPTPKALIVTCETIFPEHRKELKETFNCQLYDQYAASEPSCFWCDCEYGVMHENPEYGISEIVDKSGMPVKPGESGDVLVSSFLNPGMILLRYKIGDRAVKGSIEPCKCGRQMPRIERIEGRFDDIFYIPERGYVGRLDAPLKGMQNIIESQVIQEDFDNIQILIVPDPDYDPEMNKTLVENMRYVVGKKVNIDVKIVSQIPRSSGGKFIAQLSKVKHLYPDQVDLYLNKNL